MNNNLKKLNRKQLLEILLEQTKRIEELEVELQKTKDKLKDKNVKINNVGSLAEASLILSDIFKSFQDKTIIVISHRNANSDLFDRLINIEKGGIQIEKNDK